MIEAIYIRTSTGEQTPELQLRDIQSFFNVQTNFNLFTDKQSAFKDNKDRGEFEQLKKDIKYGVVSDLYIWDLDRLYRNRLKLIEFFQFCKAYKCKIHSFRQNWLEDIHKMPSPWNEIVHDLLLQIMGWLAEEESIKKSQRVKMALKKDENGVTVSHKGNKWGRRNISKQAISKVLELRKENPSISIRDIAKQILITDKNKNMKAISKSVVHKILVEFLGKNEVVIDEFIKGTN